MEELRRVCGGAFGAIGDGEEVVDAFGSEGFQEPEAALLADEPLVCNSSGEGGAVEEESNADGRGFECADEVELFGAEFSIGGVEGQEPDIAEHGAVIGGPEAGEEGVSSSVAFGVTKRDGVGNRDAWLDGAEQSCRGFCGVGVEHAAEEVDVVCGPAVGVCEECVERCVGVCVGARDEQSEGPVPLCRQG